MQHQLLSDIELGFLLASCRSLFYESWCFQICPFPTICKQPWVLEPSWWVDGYFCIPSNEFLCWWNRPDKTEFKSKGPGWIWAKHSGGSQAPTTEVRWGREKEKSQEKSREWSLNTLQAWSWAALGKELPLFRISERDRVWYGEWDWRGISKWMPPPHHKHTQLVPNVGFNLHKKIRKFF